MKTTSKNKDDLRNEDDLKNEDDFKNENDLKNKDDLKKIICPPPHKQKRQHFHAKTTSVKL